MNQTHMPSRRAETYPPHGWRTGMVIPALRGTAGGDRCPRPTERKRPAGVGTPAVQNGNGRRGSVSPPYRTARWGSVPKPFGPGWRSAQPT